MVRLGIGMEQDWREANRANWDERVPLHLRAHSYNIAPLRAGRGLLTPIEESELGPVDRRRFRARFGIR